MLRFGYVATPAVAATVAVPASVPPPGFVAIAIVTFAVKLVTVLPSPSSTVTCTAGAIVTPANSLVGSPVHTSSRAPRGGGAARPPLPPPRPRGAAPPPPPAGRPPPAGLGPPPAVTLVGCPVKTRRFAAAGSMLNVELVAPVSPLALVLSV